MVSSPLVILNDDRNRLNYFINDKSKIFYNTNVLQNIDFTSNSGNEIRNINFSQSSDTDSTTMVCSDYSCNEEHCCDPNVTIYHPYLDSNNFQYCNEHHNINNQTDNKCCEIQKWLDSIINEVRSEIAAEKCECSNIQTCIHERVSLANLTQKEIAERKRYQNRKAAAKYRLKKKVNLQMDKFEMDLLNKKNKMLKELAYELESEIKILESFLINNFNLSLPSL
uniref:BZIP domain-containing protein n=1 Tax=Strongyloides stercoralis TaxID=6248 RepID=A0A0K0ELH4_STRER